MNKKNFKKPIFTKYLSITELTEDSYIVNPSGSNVSEGANATYAADDCYDAKQEADTGDYLGANKCFTEA